MSTETDKKAPVVPAEPPPITKEEAPFVDKFLGGLFTGKKEKPAKIAAEETPEPKLDGDGKVIEEVVEDEAAKKKAADDLAKKKSDKAAAANKKRVETAAPTAPDYEKIAEASARGVAQALKANNPEPKKEPEPTLDFLSEDEQAELPVLEQMEKANPTRYKGLSKKFTDAIKARQDYEAAWLKENSSKEFDPEAEEHNEFFAKNDVDWKDRDYQEALTDLKVAPAIKKLEEKNLAELEKLSAKDRAKEIEPLAASEAKRNGKTLFDAIGGEFAKVIGANGQPDPKVLGEIYADDETRAGIVFNAATSLEHFTAENLRLFTGVAKYDENNPTHKYLSDFAVHHETQMEQLDREQTKDKSGREFTTAVLYSKMNKEQRAKHWTFSARDLNDLLAADQVKAVKLSIEADEKRLNAVIAKRGFKKEPTLETNGNGKPATEKKVEEEEKPLEVAGGDGTLLAHRFKTPDPARGTGLNRFVGGLLGK